MTVNTLRFFRSILFLLAGLSLVVLAACSNGESGPDLSVEDAWVRSSPLAEGNGSAYLTIRNRGNEADALIGVSAAASEAAEIHEMQMEGDVMKMRPVTGQRLEIPARSNVELKPGGLHIMLLDLKQKLEAGQKTDLTLLFEKSGEQTISVEIRTDEGEEMHNGHSE